MSFASNLWTRLVNAIQGEAMSVDETFTALEKKLMPGFSALTQKIEATIGEQGVTVLEQGLTDIATVIASGGNISVAIATLVPQVTAQVSADLKQDANIAAHGAIELLIAGLPAPAADTGPKAA